MKNKIDNILMGMLWLIAAVLGTSFWFNTQFGFNIFSSAHWHHLAYMQASQQPVKPMFYISLVMIVIITIFGLYILLTPRKSAQSAQTKPTQQPLSTITQQTTSPVPTTQTHPTPETIAPPNTSPVPTPAPELTRPIRLNISPSMRANMPSPATNTMAPTSETSTPATSPTPALKIPTAKSDTPQWPELREIFEQAGYTTKPNVMVNGIQTALIAIGADENLWIGAVGIKTDALQSVLNKFEQVFEDTLEDIFINISGFVISAPDAASPAAPEILTFDTPGMLREYMNEHHSATIEPDEQENFDAYSNYISTVLEYIGKM